MARAPATGTRITHGPRACDSGVTDAVLEALKKNRLVKKLISRIRARATYAPMTPMTIAKAPMVMRRRGVVESASSSAMSRGRGAVLTIYWFPCNLR